MGEAHVYDPENFSYMHQGYGYQIYPNFVRQHVGLDGKTPAEKCGIKIEGDNKWMTLIQNASRREV